MPARTDNDFEIYIKNVLNLLTGETANSNKRVDAEEVKKVIDILYEANAIRRVYGVDCVDNGSDNTHTILNLKTSQGTTGLAEVGNWAMAMDDSGNVWTVDIVGANAISFGIAQRRAGAKVAGYNLAAFIDILEIAIFPYKPVFGKSNLDFIYNSLDGITGEAIPFDTTAATKIHTYVGAVKTALEAEHSAAGVHNAGVITSAALSPTSFANEGGESLLKNGDFEYWGLGAIYRANTNILPANWLAFNVATATGAEAAIKVSGNYSCRIVAGGADQGVRQSLDQYIMYQGKQMTFSANLYTSVNDIVEISIWDGVGETDSTTVVAATTWTRINVTRTLNAAATEVTVRIKSKGAGTIYAEQCTLKTGGVSSSYVASSFDIISGTVYANPACNLLFNSDFIDWSNGIVSPFYPNRWTVGIGAPAATARSMVTTKYGTYYWELTLDDSDGVMTYIPNNLARIIDSSDMIFSAWIQPHAAPGTNPFQIRAVTTAGTTTSSPIYPDSMTVGTWNLVWLKIPQNLIGGVLTQIHIENVTVDASNARFYIDTPQLYVGSNPSTTKLPSLYSMKSMSFSGTGILAGDAYLYKNNSNIGTLTTLPDRAIIYQFLASCSALAGGGANPIIKLYQNGAAVVAYNLTLAAAATVYTVHIPTEVELLTTGLIDWAYLDVTVPNSCSNPEARLDYLQLNG